MLWRLCFVSRGILRVGGVGLQVLVNVDLEEAQKVLKDLIQPLPGEPVPILQALDRIVSRDLLVSCHLPAARESAVDGFAIPEGWEPGTGTLLLQNSPGLSGSNASLSWGQTVIVTTGATLPDGAGAVVAREKARVNGKYVSLLEGIAPGMNVKNPGEDFLKGDLLAPCGTQVSPGMIGVMAALGMKEVEVYRRPRVAVLSLASQIVPYHDCPGPNQLRDSNGPLLASLVTRDGGQVIALEAVGNRSPHLIRGDLQKLLDQTELVITTGGTYAAEKNEVETLLEGIDAHLLFSGVKIQPGSHPVAATWDSRLILGLSGNPAACLVGYQLLVSPLLRSWQGMDYGRPRVKALCIDDYPRKGGLRRFIRGRAFQDGDSLKVSILPGQKPGMMRSLVECNALIDIPATHGSIEPGDEVSVIMITGDMQVEPKLVTHKK